MGNRTKNLIRRTLHSYDAFRMSQDGLNRCRAIYSDQKCYRSFIFVFESVLYTVPRCLQKKEDILKVISFQKFCLLLTPLSRIFHLIFFQPFPKNMQDLPDRIYFSGMLIFLMQVNFQIFYPLLRYLVSRGIPTRPKRS